MKVNILNNHEVVLVEVPEGATNFRVAKAHNDMRCLFHSKGFKLLSYVEWSILGPGTASQVSEEDAKGIVEENPGLMMPMKYRHYGKPHYHYCDTAIQSLFTYIRANGKEPGNIVIVYRKKN